MHCKIASMRQFQCVPITYVTEINETYFEIYTKQVSCPVTFLFYISNCHSVLKYLYLYCKLFIFTCQIYITKFDFMIYALCLTGSCMVVSSMNYFERTYNVCVNRQFLITNQRGLNAISVSQCQVRNDLF